MSNYRGGQIVMVGCGTSSEASVTLASGATYTPGFDIFGRVTEVPWTQTSGGTVTTLANLAYGYNLASSRTYRRNVKAAATGYALSENYGYDGIALDPRGRGKVASGRPVPVSRSAELDARRDGQLERLRQRRSGNRRQLLHTTANEQRGQ